MRDPTLLSRMWLGLRSCRRPVAISARTVHFSDHHAHAHHRFVRERRSMCRNIRPLYHFEPPVTDDEVRAASLQFVRKVSGFTKPSAANQPAFDQAVTEVSQVVHRLLGSLVTNAPPKNREVEAAKARARSARRYGT